MAWEIKRRDILTHRLRMAVKHLKDLSIDSRFCSKNLGTNRAYYLKFRARN